MRTEELPQSIKDLAIEVNDHVKPVNASHDMSLIYAVYNEESLRQLLKNALVKFCNDNLEVKSLLSAERDVLRSFEILCAEAMDSENPAINDDYGDDYLFSAVVYVIAALEKEFDIELTNLPSSPQVDTANESQ